jgi:hypothetical protein
VGAIGHAGKIRERSDRDSYEVVTEISVTPGVGKGPRIREKVSSSTTDWGSREQPGGKDAKGSPGEVGGFTGRGRRVLTALEN